MIETFFIENQKSIKKLVSAKRELFGLDKAPLYKITPNSIHLLVGWDEKKDLPIIQAFFYSTNRIAEMLFSPDIAGSGRIFGSRLLRFNTLAVNPAGGERQANPAASALWASVRDAASSTQNFALGEVGTSFDTSTYQIYRSWDPFLTSAIGAGATVTANTFQFYRDDSLERGGNGFQNGSTTSINLVASNQGDPTAYANSDYGLVTFTGKGSLNFAATTNNAYNTITGTDQALISLTSYTKYALLTGLDLSNTQPLATTNYLSWQTAGAANPPILTVTYTPAPSNASYRSLLGVGL